MKNTFETKTQSSLFQTLGLAIGIASGVVLLLAFTSTSTPLGFSGHSQGMKIIIDDFTDAQGPDVVLPPAGSQTGSVADGNMLGDERDIILNLEISQSSGAGASIEALNGMLTFHQDAGQGAQALIIYDGQDGSADTVRTSGLNGVDLTNAGTHNALEIKVLSSSKPFNLTIIGFNGPTNSSELTKAVPQTQIEITLSFPFDEFNNSGGSSADFSNLGAFFFSELNISGGSGVDFSNLGALLLLVNFQNTVTGELDVELGPFTTAGPPPASEVLFNSAVNATSSNLIVSNFGPGNSFNAEVAQPFEVPPGESWTIEDFGWFGTYNPNPPPNPTVDVTIFNNDNGQIGEAVLDLLNLPVDMNDILLSTQLPDASLPPGIYFLRFTGNTPVGTEMKIFESPHQEAFPYLYRNPGGALEPNCTDWTPGNQCGGSENAAAIILAGTRQVDGPAVMDDSYDCIGNTGLSVRASAGVLMNDEPGQVVDFDATSAQNGSVNVASDGSFTYDPPQGFEGFDTFTYTLMNDAGGTSTASVVIEVKGMVWFIDGDPEIVNGSANEGTFLDPFPDFEFFNNAPVPAPGQAIVILPQTLPYGGNLELDDRQFVVGGWSSNVTVDRLEDQGYTVSEHSNIHTLALDFPPTLENPDGPAITLGEDNTLSNLIFGDTPTDFAIRDGDRTVGALKIDAVLVTSSGGALGILNGGDLNVDLSDVLFAGNSTLIEDPYTIHVVDVTGRIIMSTLRIGTAENPAPNCPMWFENSQVDVQIDTVEINIELDESTSPEDAVAIRASGGGSITISNGFINTKGAGIMDLENTTINLTLQELNSLESPGSAISADTSVVTMTVTGMTTFDTTGGQGINITNSSISMNFADVDIMSPRDIGIFLDRDTGSFTVSGSTNIDDANDTAIQITNSGEGFSASFGSTSISVNGNGIDLRDNISAAISLLDLSLHSDGGFGIRANNSGTLNIGSEENSISVTGGAALDITNTIFGEWTFTQLSSIDSPGAGINLGGVVGDIQASNVTIENPGAEGIFIENCGGNYSFDAIDIITTNKALQVFNNGVHGDLVISFQEGMMTSAGLAWAGNLFIEGAVTVQLLSLEDVSGRIAIPEGSKMFAQSMQSQISSESTAAMQVEIGNNAVVELVFEDNTVEGPGGEGIKITTSDTSDVLVTLSGNDVSSDSSNFSLIQRGASFLRLDGFAGGDSAAVAAFIQENNVGTPTVSVSGTISGDGTTSVNNTEDEVIPSHFELAQNFPNPFNPETTIRYLLPGASHVKLAIYNLRGQRIVTLVDREQQPGTYSVQWDGLNEAGQDVASGVYLYQLQTKEFISVQKLALIR